MATNIFLPFNSKPVKGKPYFAVGGVSWSAEAARNFMGDATEWRKLSRQGWKILKYEIKPPKLRRNPQ